MLSIPAVSDLDLKTDKFKVDDFHFYKVHFAKGDLMPKNLICREFLSEYLHEARPTY